MRPIGNLKIKHMKIFLIGFMGSGKTTIGKRLAEKLKYKFIDLDSLIELNEKLSIDEIFKQKGEKYFREIEHQELKKICNNENTVISVGGGTPCYYNNMEIMNNEGCTVYIKLSPSGICKRLLSLSPEEVSSRPLIAGKSDEELKNFVINTLNIREPYYQKSKIIILNEDKTIEDTVKRLTTLIFEFYGK
jgi:shikimate kinase